jgi:hypothetical protein
LGRRAAHEAEGCSIEDLVTRLTCAQSMIEKSVFDPRVILIPYRAGSRPYTPAEHLGVVNDHVGDHLARVEAAYAARTG